MHVTFIANDMRARILSETRRLTIDAGAIPSLNAVADAAGVSKGGLIHHFPTRDSLVEGLAREALAEIDDAMTEAAARGGGRVTREQPADSQRGDVPVAVTPVEARLGSPSLRWPTSETRLPGDAGECLASSS